MAPGASGAPLPRGNGTATLSGAWYQFGSSGRFDIEVTIRDEKMEGSGQDEVGEFTVNGTLTATEVSFVKTYKEAHTLYYAGQAGDDGEYKGHYGFQAGEKYDRFDMMVENFTPVHRG
eukprot:m.444245 g.444245  ORF g.444245 m.444245 type:complete len:118 (+) comp19075_c0_seq1:66-419(+)